MLFFAVFHGEADAFAAVEDLEHDPDDEEDEEDAAEAHGEVGVAVDEVGDGLKDRRAEPDGEQREDHVLDELARERGQQKWSGAHFEDARGELEELERGGRRAHGGDEDGEEFLAFEAVSHALVAFAVDALEEDEFATGATDQEGNQRAQRGGSRSHQAEEEELVRLVMDVADDDAVHGAGDGNEGGVEEREAAYAPDSEGFEEGEEDSGKFVERRDGVDFH